MKRFFPYIAFACLTGFTAITGLPVMAGLVGSEMCIRDSELSATHT